MGWRFRKSVKILPGVKLNFNKNSTSLTLGGRGAHYTVNSNGRKTLSAGIPGTGLSYTEQIQSGRPAQNNRKTLNDISSPVVYFFLTFFLGIIGVHRFYRGQIGIGILYLITGGIFFIGWFIDLINAIILLVKYLKNS